MPKKKKGEKKWLILGAAVGGLLAGTVLGGQDAEFTAVIDALGSVIACNVIP